MGTIYSVDLQPNQGGGSSNVLWGIDEQQRLIIQNVLQHLILSKQPCLQVGMFK